MSDEDFERGMTWDVRLALALLEATSDPQIGGKFWSIYGRLLPEPHTVTVRPPSCSVTRMLARHFLLRLRHTRDGSLAGSQQLLGISAREASQSGGA